MIEVLRPYATLEEIETVVNKFESCAVAPTEFHHREHLTVALCYLRAATEQAAIDRMRASLLRFVRHHQLDQVYNETITVFWIKHVRHFLDQSDAGGRPLVELVNELLRTYADPSLINSYFSKEQLDSEEARDGWIEPDSPIGGGASI